MDAQRTVPGRNYVNVGLPTPLANAADALVKQKSLGFVSRGEVFKHVLRNYLLELVRAKVLPPEILRKIK